MYRGTHPLEESLRAYEMPEDKVQVLKIAKEPISTSIGA
jgi:hypothetical protein